MYISMFTFVFTSHFCVLYVKYTTIYLFCLVIKTPPRSLFTSICTYFNIRRHWSHCI